jgi:putative flippase GtrA
MNIKSEKERTRFFRFLIVGTIGAVVDFGTYNLLMAAFKMDPTIAQMFSFTAAVISNFLWNRFWTYPDSRTKSVVRQLVQFFVINAIGLGIRTLLFDNLRGPISHLFTIVLPNFFLSPDFMGKNFTLASVILIVLLWNFFANRLWTYNDVAS